MTFNISTFLFMIIFLLLIIKNSEARVIKSDLNMKIIQTDTLKNENQRNFENKNKDPNFWKFSSRGYLRFDFGWNFPQNQGANLDHSIWGSRGVSLFYLHAYPLFNSAVSFNPGIGISHIRYKFKNDVVLLERNGNVETENFYTYKNNLLNDTENRTLEKSIFTQTFLEIPLEIAYHGYKNRALKSGFLLAVGIKFGFNISNKVKWVYNESGEKITEKIKKEFHVNNYRSVLTFRIGWTRYNFFAEYSLTPIFKSGKGPGNSADMRSLLIGMSFDFI